VLVRHTSVYTVTEGLFWSKTRPAFFIFEQTVASNGTVVLSVLSVTLVTYRGQTVGRIKMPLGTEVGFSPSDIELDGDPAPPTGTAALHFSAHVYCGQTVAHLGCC